MAHFLKWTFYLICMWVGEDQRANYHKDMCLRETRLCLQISTTTLHSIVYTIGRTCVSG